MSHAIASISIRGLLKSMSAPNDPTQGGALPSVPLQPVVGGPN